MLIVVSYDIADDRRRTWVAKTMEDYGRRVQFSVFECFLEEDRLQKMKKTLAKFMDLSEDSVRIYRLCRKDRETIEVLGKGTVRAEEDVVVL